MRDNRADRVRSVVRITYLVIVAVMALGAAIVEERKNVAITKKTKNESKNRRVNGLAKTEIDQEKMRNVGEKKIRNNQEKMTVNGERGIQTK